MTSYVYYKFKSSITQQNISFEGSALSVSDLKREIASRNGSKTISCDYVILNSEEKELDEKFLIPKYTSVVVKRVPLANYKPIKKTNHVENFDKTDPYKIMRKNEEERLKNINSLKATITEEEKLDLFIEISSKTVNNGKRLPMGRVPINYVCNKCKVSGHWTQECPGIKDKDGNYVPANKVKRPSGIPTTCLTEVDASTKNSYLTDDGRYVVNTKDHEAILKGKKEKIPFSKEENPPMLVTVNINPPSLICDFCKDIFTNPICTPCCKKAYCLKCVTDNIFDCENVLFHKCPHCNQTIDVFDSLVENTFLIKVISEWKLKKISKNDVERLVVQGRDDVKLKDTPNINYDFDDVIFSSCKDVDHKPIIKEFIITNSSDLTDSCPLKEIVTDQEIPVLNSTQRSVNQERRRKDEVEHRRRRSRSRSVQRRRSRSRSVKRRMSRSRSVKRRRSRSRCVQRRRSRSRSIQHRRSRSRSHLRDSVEHNMEIIKCRRNGNIYKNDTNEKVHHKRIEHRHKSRSRSQKNSKIIFNSPGGKGTMKREIKDDSTRSSNHSRNCVEKSIKRSKGEFSNDRKHRRSKSDNRRDITDVNDFRSDKHARKNADESDRKALKYVREQTSSNRIKQSMDNLPFNDSTNSVKEPNKHQEEMVNVKKSHRSHKKDKKKNKKSKKSKHKSKRD